MAGEAKWSATEKGAREKLIFSCEQNQRVTERKRRKIETARFQKQNESSEATRTLAKSMPLKSPALYFGWLYSYKFNVLRSRTLGAAASSFHFSR